MKRFAQFEHLPLAVRCLHAAGLSLLLCAVAQLISAGSAWKLLIWPSAAVGFAFAWYHGLRWLPVAATGAGLWALAATQDPRYALILGAASMLGPWQAIRLLRRLADWKPPEYRLDSVSRFLAMSLLVSAPIDALLFGGLVYTFQIAPLHQYGVAQLLLSAWLADVLGMLLVCPALLALLRPARLTADEEEAAVDGASPRFSILTVLVVLGIGALAYVLHRLGQGHYAGLVLFAVFVPMIWAAASQATGRADAYTLLLAGLPLLASRAYAVTDTHGAGFGETVSVSLLLCCAVLAAQLLQALGRELGRKLPLAALFEAPTPLQLAAWLEGGEDQPSAQTTEQPASPAASHVPTAEPADTIARRADRSVAPLSLMQQRLYFLESINPGTPVYNTPSAHRLTGKLNEYAFQRAFNQLMQRQPILRTVIDTDAQGMPEQRVMDNLQVSLFPAMDLSKLQGQAQEAALRHAIDSLAQEPIPLHGAPLFRTRMFRLGEEQHVWFFMPHHIIWDGWSFDLLYQEMAALYAHQMEKPGAADPLPPLAIDYGDFAGWHHQFLKSDTLQKQVDHWLSIIDPKLPPLDVPADRKRPARMSGLGSTEWLYLPEPLVARLREHAREQHTTPFMTLLAVWALLLHGLSRQPTLRIGTPVRGRELPELEQVMGFFVNALPLTFHFGNDQASSHAGTHASPDSATPAGMAAGAGAREHAPRTIRQLLEQVRQTVVTAFGNSDVPADRILQAMGPSRDESRPPLWQAFFSFQEATARQLQWGNLHDKPLYVLQPGTAEDLGLWFLANGNHLVGGLQYNTDIFDALRVRRIAEAYQLLLTCWLDSAPDTPLADMLTHIPTAVLCGVDHPVTALPSTPATTSQAAAPQPPSAAPVHQPGFGEEIGIEKGATRTPPSGATPAREGIGTGHAAAREVIAAAQASAAADTPATMPATASASATEQGNGVQTQATPSPDAAADGVATAEAPLPAEDAGSMEATLTGVWADLLGTDDIRSDDNFFDLGGHSMLVMQAIARMEVLTGRRVNPRRFVFETLAQVAHAYEEAQSGPAPEADTAGRKGGLMARMLGGLRKRH